MASPSSRPRRARRHCTRRRKAGLAANSANSRRRKATSPFSAAGSWGGRRSAQQMLAALQDVPEDVMDKLQQMAGQLFTTAFSTIKGRLTPGKEK